MVALKAAQVEGFAARPKSGILGVLIYGQDEGRISETAAKLAASWLKLFGEGGEVLRLDEKSLSDNPDILGTELRAMPMFGGRNVIRLRPGNRLRLENLRALVSEPLENLLIIESGNLKPSSPLRKLFEKQKNLAALPCYQDEQRDLARMIEEELTGAGVQLSADARQTLLASLGSDHGISRQELKKLALYAHDKKELEVKDILRLTGNSSQLAHDRLIDLTLSSQSAAALATLERFLASEPNSAGIPLSFLRRFERLYKLHAQMQSGQSAQDALRSLRPPVHFRQKDTIIRQLQTLPASQIKKGINIVQETILRMRRDRILDKAHLERMVIFLARLSNRR